MNIARAIWKNAIIREGLLLVVTSVAVTLALSASDLADALQVSDAPLREIKTWASGAWVAVLVTGLKQGTVYVLTKLGRIPSSPSPPTTA